MELISVIIPVYNGEKYLAKCLDSILNQTYKHFEIIIVDNNSQDNSYQLAMDYALKDERIKVYHQKVSGVSHTRNYGVSVAKGTYIQFIDCDDYIEANLLQYSYELISKEHADLVCTGLILNIQDPKGLKLVNQTTEFMIADTNESIMNKVLETMHGTYFNSPVNKLYRKAIIDKYTLVMPTDIDLGEDLIFNLAYVSNCHKVIFADQCFYHYQMRLADNLSIKYRSNKVKLMFEHYEVTKAYLDSLNANKEAYIKLNTLFVIWMYSAYNDLHYPSCNLSYYEKLHQIKTNNDTYLKYIKAYRVEGLKAKVLKLALYNVYTTYYLSKLIYLIKTNYRTLFY